MKKIIAIGSILLSSVVLVATSKIVFEYWKIPNQIKDIGDWIIFLPPVIAPAVSLLLACIVLSNKIISKIINGLCVGALIGISIYMFIPAFQLAFQFDLIAKDGTAYCGIMMLPVIFIGIPLLLIGAVVGLIFGWKAGKGTKTV